ncbi:hypothetical protein [Nocardioides daphniae]|uniref:Uncharacterized protein n=1 Tax=Nocardioides daphniae TaxID=402297 RepID=A0A4P7U8A8_9ACTN|nr:hypothetical protein [Nocardioides daphniae]QCC76382.1 hypothetical protein E2C04_02650 [Nocardioides daphniae]GGD07391.1 hypothetical protein GCM10007231_02600 [Nocardioides daphniae]
MQKSRKVMAALATPVAVLAAGALVYQASYAAFTGQTRNSGNNWATGSIKLTDDDNGTSRFQVTAMKPGDSGAACIKLTADASVPSTVKGYTINPLSSGSDLENRVKVKVEGGTGGTFANCTGFEPEELPSGQPVVPEVTLTQLAAVNSFENALGGWAVPAGVHTKTYRISWRFDTAGMTQAQVDQLQGKSTGIDIQWEMRNNN